MRLSCDGRVERGCEPGVDLLCKTLLSLRNGPQTCLGKKGQLGCELGPPFLPANHDQGTRTTQEMSFIPYDPSSAYKKTTLDEWVGLSRPEIVAAFPSGTFSRDAKKTRPALLSEVHRLNAAQVKELLGSALAEKRAARAAVTSSTVGAKLNMSNIEAILREAEKDDVVVDRFMDLPSEECVRNCHRNYLEATSNSKLKRVVCQSCARLLWRSACLFFDLDSIPNKSLLEPKHPHPHHELFRSMLLVPEKIEFLQVNGEKRAFGYFCTDCLRFLESSPPRLPPLSLSNRMWVGRTPDALRGLTVPEQMLIALNFPRFFIFKLSTKDGRLKDPSKQQRGMKGTITTFPLNIHDVSKMLEGELLAPEAALNSTCRYWDLVYRIGTGAEGHSKREFSGASRVGARGSSLAYQEQQILHWHEAERRCAEDTAGGRRS